MYVQLYSIWHQRWWLGQHTHEKPILIVENNYQNLATTTNVFENLSQMIEHILASYMLFVGNKFKLPCCQASKPYTRPWKCSKVVQCFRTGDVDAIIEWWEKS